MNNKIFRSILILSLGCVVIFAFYSIFIHKPARAVTDTALYENDKYYLVIAFYNYGDINFKIKDKVTGSKVTHSAVYISDNTARCELDEDDDIFSYDFVFYDDYVELVYNGTDGVEGKYQGKYNLLRNRKF